jgi:hypothetical protein
MNIVRHAAIASVIMLGSLSASVGLAEPQADKAGPLQVLWQFEAGG